MAKICEPPIFQGGQCSTSYQIIYTAIQKEGYQVGLKVNRSVRGIGGQQSFFGPISGIGKPYVINNNWFVDVNHKTFQGSAVTTRGNIDLTSSGIPSYSEPVFKELLGTPDNCGNGEEKCKCEGSDFTVQCASEKGGICCVAKSFIAGICGALGYG